MVPDCGRDARANHDERHVYLVTSLFPLGCLRVYHFLTGVQMPGAFAGIGIVVQDFEYIDFHLQGLKEDPQDRFTFLSDLKQRLRYGRG